MERVIELLRSAGDGAFAIDNRQRIVFWNSACEETLGYSSKEVLGKPCYEIIGGSHTKGCSVCKPNCGIFQTSRAGLNVRTRDVQTKTRGGEELWLSVSTLRVPSAWVELSVLIHLFTDITKRKLIEQSVGKLFTEYSQLNDQQSISSLMAPSTQFRADLTARETDVLRELSTGATTPEISERLSISASTARNHIHHILSKLGVRNRLEAVTLAMRLGMYFDT